MTTMSWPDHLLTLEEFEQLPEDTPRRYELQDGLLHVTPKAASLHQRAVGSLTARLNEQLPAAWEAVPAVEVVSPGSSQTDRVTERHEYVRANIPDYWVLDLDEPVTLSENRLDDGVTARRGLLPCPRSPVARSGTAPLGG